LYGNERKSGYDQEMRFHIIGISVTAKIARITARDEIGIFKFIMQIGDDRMVTADKYLKS
jgi:hypothetical protein